MAPFRGVWMVAHSVPELVHSLMVRPRALLLGTIHSWLGLSSIPVQDHRATTLQPKSTAADDDQCELQNEVPLVCAAGLNF